MKPLLIAYDGSPDAKTALEYAAGVFPGREAVVLTVWEPLLVKVAAAEAMMAVPVPDDVDATEEKAALQVAEDGAALANSLGLKATARAVSDTFSVWQAIDDVADQLDAEAIVTGSRGLTGLHSLIVGSVSALVLKHARRPVLVVPSAHLAKARHEAPRGE